MQLPMGSCAKDGVSGYHLLDGVIGVTLVIAAVMVEETTGMMTKRVRHANIKRLEWIAVCLSLASLVAVGLSYWLSMVGCHPEEKHPWTLHFSFAGHMFVDLAVLAVIIARHIYLKTKAHRERKRASRSPSAISGNDLELCNLPKPSTSQTTIDGDTTLVENEEEQIPPPPPTPYQMPPETESEREPEPEQVPEPEPEPERAESTNSLLDESLLNEIEAVVSHDGATKEGEGVAFCGNHRAIFLELSMRTHQMRIEKMAKSQEEKWLESCAALL